MKPVQWHYLQDNRSVGPMPKEQIISMIKDGNLSDSILVWHPGTDIWRPANEIFHLDETLPPPLPQIDIASAVRLRDDIWTEQPVHLWRRCFGRFLNLVVNDSIFFAILSVIWYSFDPPSARDFFNNITAPKNAIPFFMLTTFIVCFINAAYIGFTGTSIGKFIFGVRVTDGDDTPIGYINAVKRELRIWVWGMAMGILPLCPIAMFMAWRDTKQHGKSRWDREMNLKVIYRQNNLKQFILNGLGFAALLAIILFLHSL